MQTNCYNIAMPDESDAGNPVEPETSRIHIDPSLNLVFSRNFGFPKFRGYSMGVPMIRGFRV